MITVTPKAAEKLKDILTEEAGVYLRVFVQGGGCSGLQYGLQPEKTPTEGSDQVIESNDVKVVVDPISINYLRGAEIDFEENSTGGGFTVKNPNATSTCGCGSSFNTE